MNKVLISIGSNIEPEINLEKSRSMLVLRLENVRFTKVLETTAYGKHYHGNFLNQLAVAYTEYSLEKVNEVAKQIEGLLGRLPEHKQQGSVIVDIDLFGWNGCIVRPEDYNRPYVQRLLPDLEAIL